MITRTMQKAAQTALVVQVLTSAIRRTKYTTEMSVTLPFFLCLLLCLLSTWLYRGIDTCQFLNIWVSIINGLIFVLVSLISFLEYLSLYHKWFDICISVPYIINILISCISIQYIINVLISCINIQYIINILISCISIQYIINDLVSSITIQYIINVLISCITINIS
jgi:hypothetical protein